VAGRVLDVDNIETTWMSLAGHDGTHATDVLTANDVAHVTSVEFDPVGDLVAGKVEFDGVANFAVRVGVSDASAVVCDEEWDVVLGAVKLLDTAKLVAGLFGGDSVDDESALGVVDETEVLVGLVDGDDVHVSSGVLDIGSYLAVDLDHAAHHDLHALLAAKSVVESVTDEDGEWQALAKLVWSSVRSVAEHAAGLGQHPVVWRIERLQMFLRSATSHVELFCFLTIFLEFSVSST